jgi:hypothetical protein
MKCLNLDSQMIDGDSRVGADGGTVETNKSKWGQRFRTRVEKLVEEG